jgi:hypothetical protein
MLVTFWINPKENEEVYGGKNRKGGGALDNKKGKNFREGKRATQVVSNVRSARKNSRAAFFKSPQCRRTLFRLFCKFGHSAAPPRPKRANLIFFPVTSLNFNANFFN